MQARRIMSHRLISFAAIRSALSLVALGALVYSICWNIWAFSQHPGGIPPPGVTDDIVAWEEKFRDIQDALYKENYRSGHMDYMTIRSFHGQPRTEADDVHWVELRYVAIPVVLVQEGSSAPYVLGDFTVDKVVPEALPGLITIRDARNGLVLYKRAPTP
jgi:hypothetical protein